MVSASRTANRAGWASAAIGGGAGSVAWGDAAASAAAIRTLTIKTLYKAGSVRKGDGRRSSGSSRSMLRAGVPAARLFSRFYSLRASDPPARHPAIMVTERLIFV